MVYARDAIPVMEALGAYEDVAQLKAVLAVGAMEAGRLDEAERIFDEIEAEDMGAGIFGGAIILLCGRAELDAGRGPHRRRAARLPRRGRGHCPRAGSRASRCCSATSRGCCTPSPRRWSPTCGTSARRRWRGCVATCCVEAPEILDGAAGFLDYPVFGSVLFALALWELAADPDPARAARAVRLLVYADRFGYNRQLPSLAWEPAARARRVGAARARRPACAPRSPDRKATELRDRGQGPRRGARELVVSHLAAVAPHRQRQEDRDHDRAAEQRPADVRR